MMGICSCIYFFLNWTKGPQISHMGAWVDEISHHVRGEVLLLAPWQLFSTGNRTEHHLCVMTAMLNTKSNFRMLTVDHKKSDHGIRSFKNCFASQYFRVSINISHGTLSRICGNTPFDCYRVRGVVVVGSFGMVSRCVLLGTLFAFQLAVGGCWFKLLIMRWREMHRSFPFLTQQSAWVRCVSMSPTAWVVIFFYISRPELASCCPKQVLP